MKIDTEALRRNAEAAPPGPWLYRAKSNSMFSPPPEGSKYTYGNFLFSLNGDDESDEAFQAIEHIRRCSPDVILALLAERSALLAVAQAARKYRDNCPADEDATKEFLEASCALRSALAAWERDGGDQKEE